MTRMDRRSAVSIPVSAADERLHASSLHALPVTAWASSTVTVTSSATPHALGAWTEIVASTASDVDWLILNVAALAVNGADTSALMDIATGGAGSETAIVSSVPVGHAASGVGISIPLPVRVVAGSRLSVRMQALVVSETAITAIIGMRTFIRARNPTTLVTLGAVTASSRGTNMPTNDTYVEITAATTVPLQGVVVAPAGGGATSMASETSIYTVAVGGAGAEVAIGTCDVTSGSSETINRGVLEPLGVIPAAIPTGSRIACKQSIGRNYRDVIILGVPVS